MFGYVKPCIPELKVKDLEKFKAYYCGLCHSIKNIYGNLPRLSLNYDMAFLAILLDALTSSDIDFKKIVCPVHPLTKKALVTSNSALNYAAHMNISLVYYKLLDDIKDDHDIKSWILSKGLKSKVNSYTKNFGEINLEIYYNLMELSRLEADTGNELLLIDEICHPFARLTAMVLSSYDGCSLTKNQHDSLYNLGYNLGKWIYLVDAMDDLYDDMKHNKFNAINRVFNKDNLPYKDFREQICDKIDFLLVSCGAQCLDSLKNLPLKKNEDLLFNIVHLGIMEITEKSIKGVIHNE